MGKLAHNCITQFFESRRDTLAPHASNAQGGPLCKRGGCVRTLRTPPAYGLASIVHRSRKFSSILKCHWLSYMVANGYMERNVQKASIYLRCLGALNSQPNLLLLCMRHNLSITPLLCAGQDLEVLFIFKVCFMHYHVFINIQSCNRVSHIKNYLHNIITATYTCTKKITLRMFSVATLN